MDRFGRGRFGLQQTPLDGPFGPAAEEKSALRKGNAMDQPSTMPPGRMKYTMIVSLYAAGTAVFALGLVSPVSAGPTRLTAVSAQRTAADPLQKLLDDVAGLNENLVEFALDDNAAKITETANAIEASLPKLRTAVPAATFTAIEARVRDQRTAVKARNRTGAALASVEIYRLLQDAMDPRARRVPVQVPLLDYAGFKILALARSDAVDWAGIDATRKEAASFWKQVEARIGSAALRNLLGSIMTGLADASAAKNPAYAAFAAKMLLESVDLLEGHFTPR